MFLLLSFIFFLLHNQRKDGRIISVEQGRGSWHQWEVEVAGKGVGG
jgi:hypothetical protein